MTEIDRKTEIASGRKTIEEDYRDSKQVDEHFTKTIKVIFPVWERWITLSNGIQYHPVSFKLIFSLIQSYSTMIEEKDEPAESNDLLDFPFLELSINVWLNVFTRVSMYSLDEA